MRGERQRTRSFVVGLAAWSALSLAPLIALSPPLATTFLVLASALATSVTLLVSLGAGVVVAVVSACLFTVALAALAAPQSGLDPAALAAALGSGGAVLQALLGLLALGGAVAFGELVSLSLQGDPAAGQGAEAERGERGEGGGVLRRVRVRRRNGR